MDASQSQMKGRQHFKNKHPIMKLLCFFGLQVQEFDYIMNLLLCP